MIVTVPVTGQFEENCYFYLDPESLHGFVIDPGAEAEKLLKTIREHGWTIEAILLTHGHFDHIGAVDALRDALKVPVRAHAGAAQYLEHPEINLSAFCGNSFTVKNTDPISDGEEIILSANTTFRLKALYTPGHTTDSITFVAQNEAAAFVGDTIFLGSIGNCEYPGGDFAAIRASILERILTLPPETVLHPGHGPKTTVEEERTRYGI